MVLSPVSNHGGSSLRDTAWTGLLSHVSFDLVDSSYSPNVTLKCAHYCFSSLILDVMFDARYNNDSNSRIRITISIIPFFINWINSA